MKSDSIRTMRNESENSEMSDKKNIVCIERVYAYNTKNGAAITTGGIRIGF